jgi:hypothetical protein
MLKELFKCLKEVKIIISAYIVKSTHIVRTTARIHKKKNLVYLGKLKTYN